MANRNNYQPYSDIRNVQNRGTAIDTHELLKYELDRQNDNDGNSSISSLNVNSFAGKKLSDYDSSGNASSVVMAAEPKYGFSDIELNFDSVRRERTSELTHGELLWYVAVLNNNVDVSGVVEVTLAPFYMPKIYVPNDTPDFFYFKRVYIEIANVSTTQSVLGYKGVRYHFECDVSNLAGQGVLITPIRNAFYFNNPLTSLSELRLHFYVPQTNPALSVFKQIPLPNETVVINVVPNSNPLQFTLAGLDDTTILGPVGALTSTGNPGVALFISGFTSNDPAVDALINSQYGIFATSVDNITTFTVSSINAATVNAAPTAVAFIPKNRIAFPMRFSCLRNFITNRIQINHS